jgi:hypothetical protein
MALDFLTMTLPRESSFFMLADSRKGYD